MTKGDVVVCVDPGPIVTLEEGGVYEVLSAYNLGLGGLMVDVAKSATQCGPGLVGVYAERFEVVGDVR